MDMIAADVSKFGIMKSEDLQSFCNNGGGKKVCIFMTSYGRFIELLNAIRGLRFQTVQVDKVLIFARDYSPLEIEWIERESPSNFEIINLPNYGNQLQNTFGWFVQNTEFILDYDVFGKIDDDDYYPINYVEDSCKFHPEHDFSHYNMIHAYQTEKRIFGKFELSGSNFFINKDLFYSFCQAIKVGQFDNIVAYEDKIMKEFVIESNAKVGLRPIGDYIYVRHRKNVSQSSF